MKEPSEKNLSGTDSKPDNVMTRALPKPVVYGFVALLVLSVVVPLAYRAYSASQKEAEQEQKRAATPSVEEQLTEWGEDSTPAALEAELQKNPGLVRDVDGEGWTLLHYSAAAMRADLIKVALRFHADPDEMTHDGRTPLHIVLFMQDNAGLLSEHMDIEVGDYLATMRALLDGGADPNIQMPGSGEGTPTSWARDHEMDEADAVLAEYGGDSEAHPEAYPVMRVAKGDDLWSAWNAITDAGLPEISIQQVRHLIVPEPAEGSLMCKVFSTVDGGCIVVPLGENAKVGTLIYWPDAERLQSSEGPDYVDAVDLRLP